jgi:hypothetical protein
MSTPKPVANGIRRVLDAHVADGTPSTEATERVWQRLQHSVEQGTPGEHEHLAAARPRWPLLATLVLGFAAAAVLVVVGLRAGVRALSRASDEAPSAAASALEDTAPADRLQPRQVEPESVQVEEPPRTPSNDVAKEPRDLPPTQRPTSKPAPRASPQDAVDHRLRSLADELRVLEAAQAALREEDPEGALELLGQHEREFGDARLEEERRVLRAIALCKAGRLKQGRGEARVFVKANPTSNLANRVRDACGLGQ